MSWDAPMSWDDSLLDPCIRQPILRLLPCLLLWLLTPVHLLSKSSNPSPIRWSVLFMSRVVLAAAACLVNIIEVFLLMSDRGYDSSSLIEFWTPVIVACTYLLLIFLMIQSKSKGFTRSASCWIFLLSSNITAGINYSRLLDPQVSLPGSGYYTGLVFLPLIFVLLIASSVTETILPDTSRPRFRKRDKILFYGRQMLRKVRSTLAPGGKNNPREYP